MSTELGTRMPDGGLQQMLSVDGGEMRALCMPLATGYSAMRRDMEEGK